VAVLLTTAVLAPAVAHLREEKTRRIADLTRVARVAQDAVLTPVPSTVGPLRFATVYESASREALIGGDLFAVVSGHGESRLLVGDVRGKGLDAVKTAALVLALYREASSQGRSLAEVADHCDGQLRAYLDDEDFVTAIFASIDDHGHTELLSCGHPAPLLVHDGQLSEVDIPLPAGPLGLAVDSGQPEPISLQLVPGDRLLFFTDGFVEARDHQGAFVELGSLVNELRASSFDDALPAVLRRLHATAGRIDDDVALLLVEFGTPLTSDAKVGALS
jgi:serine phosphatase RsbU (regulator of sigma subunit)